MQADDNYQPQIDLLASKNSKTNKHTESQFNNLHLLYRFQAGEAEKVIAIANLDTNRKIVHGKGLSSGEGVFEIVHVFAQDELGPDNESLQPKSYVAWPLNRATSNWGNIIDSIKFRASFLENYLRNRTHAKDE